MILTGVSIFEPSIDDLLRWGADFGPSTTGGQWWRLLTSSFLHVGVVHLLANLVGLATFGPLVERLYGSAAFLALYIVGALTASLASVSWNPVILSAGASGAIFAVVGATLV